MAIRAMEKEARCGPFLYPGVPNTFWYIQTEGEDGKPDISYGQGTIRPEGGKGYGTYGVRVAMEDNVSFDQEDLDELKKSE